MKKYYCMIECGKWVNGSGWSYHEVLETDHHSFSDPASQIPGILRDYMLDGVSLDLSSVIPDGDLRYTLTAWEDESGTFDPLFDDRDPDFELSLWFNQLLEDEGV